MNKDIEVGNLTITIQSIRDTKGRAVQAAFCTLWYKENTEEKKINFTFALNYVPEFKKHIQAMIDEAVEQVNGGNKTKTVRRKTKKATA
jgi:hypothetical protein